MANDQRDAHGLPGASSYLTGWIKASVQTECNLSEGN